MASAGGRDRGGISCAGGDVTESEIRAAMAGVARTLDELVAEANCAEDRSDSRLADQIEMLAAMARRVAARPERQIGRGIRSNA